jgi:uncharacterized protein YwqG
MLGHAPSSQKAMPLSANALCLLQLATDLGVGMSFGDMGEAAFWITQEDLAARRFDKTWLKMQGH